MDDERLKAELAAKRDQGAVLRRLRGLRQTAASLLGGGVPGAVRRVIEEGFAQPQYARQHLVAQRRGAIGEEFKSHSEADWRRSVAVMLPAFAPSAEAAIHALARRPFQEGITRRPFRCPRSPATLADVRGRWLVSTTLMLGDYDADIRWVAERAAHLTGWSGGADMGWLLAGAIDAGGDAGRDVFDILTATASGQHESAQMGRHVTQALMSCGRPDAWEFAEKLLLAAQRQEGLRQAILESVDEAHPEAFRRMLRLILDEDLGRFSSVVRAADTWLGFAWDGSSGVHVESLLRRILLFLDDPSARAAALDESDAETVYLALWATAFEDVDAAIPPAVARLAAPTAEVRFVATHFLVQSLWQAVIPPLVDALADPDLRVAARALDLFETDLTSEPVVDGPRLFARLEELLARIPKRSQSLPAIVWPWWSRKLERPQVAAALAANSTAVPGERLLPYVPELAPAARAAFIRRAAGLHGRWEAPGEDRKRRAMSRAERTVALDLLGDASADVRAACFGALGTLPLETDEVDRLVDLLARKPGDLRSRAIARLGTLADADLLAAADRLLGDGTDLRRLAGLELLRGAVEAGRVREEARERLRRYAEAGPSLSERERAQVAPVLGEAESVPTTDDALGLVDPAALRTWPAPKARRLAEVTPAARASLHGLAAVVLANQAFEVRTGSGEVKLLVESVPYRFDPQKREDLESGDALVPLAATWRAWLRERPASARDDDGLELVRALLSDDAGLWQAGPAKQLSGLGEWSAGARFLRGLVAWCVSWEPPAGMPDFLLDGFETAVARIGAADYREMATRSGNLLNAWYGPNQNEPAFYRKLLRADAWLGRFRWWRGLFPASVTPGHAERLYGLLRGFAARASGAEALLVTLDDYLDAYRAGVAGEAELLDLLVGRGSDHAHGSLLGGVSARKPTRALQEHPELLALVDRCRRRVVEVETRRGDRETAASGLAMELRWTGGLETLARALPALGKTHFARALGWSATKASRQDTLSHLVIRSLPREEDTPEAFATWAREARIPDQRLVELAVYAPQWAAHVNHLLGWPGLETGVWWIQAHTKDDRSWQLKEVKEVWAAEVSERTPLAAADLTEGAVDVAWFAQAFGELGLDRWKALDTAAKYAASSAGHTRAQLFARAMGGLVTRDDLLRRIDESRHQDSVRALGLLPLADGEAGQVDLAERYLRLEEFRRQSRKFGSQRQQSEGRAVQIGLANLARTAGYRDPQRLQWAMEQRAVADLAAGPLVLARGDVQLALSVDVDGAPGLTVTKAGKALKALPAALKKDAEVEELRGRLQELKRQRSRVRGALEEAMCRGDRFSAVELATLLRHPILAPALSRLVFLGDGVAGYPAEEGRALRDHAGVTHPLGTTEEARLAHPHDLLQRGDWADWQRECYRAERMQPFKQVFRELYPITDAERGTERSRRYAGHQVNPRQALALLGGRGWVAKPEEGVGRTFHAEGLTARLGFQEAFYTPADIEGLTLEELVFTPKGEWTLLPLDAIPPRVFSEAMRDLDLAVSVAHRGGVDPEATASTVEMRAALVRETCELLGIGNIELRERHVLIDGSLGRYSVHLGSASAMLLPGTALPIVAVHSQHRGRLFLPFADDDPRTAEVLSKVLLLARDREIRDPNILEWIRAGKAGLSM